MEKILAERVLKIEPNGFFLELNAARSHSRLAFSELRSMSGNLFGHQHTEITLIKNSKFESQAKIF